MLKKHKRALSAGLLGISLAIVGRAEPIHVENYTNVIRVACIGDSITRGSGLNDPPHESYPAQLAAMLGKKWEVLTFAANGVTMLSKGSKPVYMQDFIPNAMWSEADVFIILYGTNDSIQKNWTHAEEFVRDYCDFIGNFADQLQKPRVWVCHPPPVYADDPSWTTRIQQEVIPKIDEAAAAKHVPVIDFYQPMQAHPELFGDGVHPNAAGARLMAEIVYRELTGNSPPAP